ncbi:MAG: cytochrome b/b6 domain-containing protein [Gammaproteobacteria bacterium]|nr:cytochrome b/b6 domain-containing protein [Gammaproteobacteria bacterium]
MSTRTLMIYGRFERFWHWAQMTLIFLLLFSGFAIHGLHAFVGFHNAVTLHTWSAVALIVLWLFAIFWHLTTGNWRHYLPTTNGLWRVARFYAWGIFKGEHHPYRKAFWRKHNPLQALAYLALKLLLFPAIWLSGLAYLSYNLWDELPGAGDWLGAVAMIHTLAAFAILAFVIAHVYLLTTGDSFRKHVKPMITGYDEVDLTEAEEAYLEKSPAARLK